MAAPLSQEELWIIDVSQAVDLDHPRALDFLREDALHVNDFFRRAGVATLTVRELFDFVVDPHINPGNIDAAVDALICVASSRPTVQDPEDAMADKVCTHPCNRMAPLPSLLFFFALQGQEGLFVADYKEGRCLPKIAILVCVLACYCTHCQ